MYLSACASSAVMIILKLNCADRLVVPPASIDVEAQLLCSLFWLGRCRLAGLALGLRCRIPLLASLSALGALLLFAAKEAPQALELLCACCSHAMCVNGRAAQDQAQERLLLASLHMVLSRQHALWMYSGGNKASCPPLEGNVSCGSFFLPKIACGAVL